MMIGAIDAGGTKVLTAVMTATGTVLAQRKDSMPTADVPAYFRRCTEMLSACARDVGVGVEKLDGVGMNIPGMVTPDGRVRSATAVDPCLGHGARFFRERHQRLRVG